MEEHLDASRGFFFINEKTAHGAKTRSDGSRWQQQGKYHILQHCGLKVKYYTLNQSKRRLPESQGASSSSSGVAFPKWKMRLVLLPTHIDTWAIGSLVMDE